MDETYLNRCFCGFQEYQSGKVIRNNQTGQSEGYGFLYIRSRDGAEQILQICNGAQMLDSDRSFYLSFAEEEDDSPDFTILVEGLDPRDTDSILKDEFKSRYQSVKSATVVRHEATGHSEGYGFVIFKDEKEQERATEDMHGEVLFSRRITIETYKRGQSAQSQSASYQNPQWIPGATDPNNTTLYVAGLKQVFSHFGEVVNAIIKPRKTYAYGFVQFSDRSSAERALSTLHGTQLGQRKIKVTWAHSFQSQQ